MERREGVRAVPYVEIRGRRTQGEITRSTPAVSLERGSHRENRRCPKGLAAPCPLFSRFCDCLMATCSSVDFGMLTNDTFKSLLSFNVLLLFDGSRERCLSYQRGHRVLYKQWS